MIKELSELSPYLAAIKFKNEYVIFELELKEGWALLKDDKVEYSSSDDNENHYVIYSKEPNASDILLEYSKRVIKHNLDKEKKIKLFKDKVDELKGLFNKLSYDELSTIEFKFYDPNAPNIPTIITPGTGSTFSGNIADNLTASSSDTLIINGDPTSVSPKKKKEKSLVE